MYDAVKRQSIEYSHSIGGLKRKTTRKKNTTKLNQGSPNEGSNLIPGLNTEEMTANEKYIRNDESKKESTSKLWKTILGDNIERSQILENSAFARFFSGLPDGMPASFSKSAGENEGGRNDKVYAVCDKYEAYPSFFKILYCHLDMDLLMMYILLFAQLEFTINEGKGNCIISLFVIYIVERCLRWLRQELGSSNLSKKACVDARYLI